MSYRLTPPLSEEGIAEVIAELEAPPADTPERRAAFAMARAARFLVQQIITHPDYRFPTPLQLPPCD